MRRLPTFIAVISLIILNVVHASPEKHFQECSSERYAIYFLNGIWTLEQDHKKSASVLRAYLQLEAQDREIDSNCLYISSSYNASDAEIFGNAGYIHDLIQAYTQALKHNDYLDIYEWISAGTPGFAGGGSNTLIISAISELADDAIPTEPTVAAFANEYQRLIQDMDATVIMVAHSQGNFFANDIYDRVVRVNNFPTDKIHVVSVATPARKVAPLNSEDSQSHGRFTTTKGDVINFVPLALNGNTTTNNCSSLISSVVTASNFLCHSFLSTYMAETETRQSILNDIFEIISAKPTAQQLTNFDHPDVSVSGVAYDGERAIVSAFIPNTLDRDAIYLALGSDNEPVRLTNTHSDNDRAGVPYAHEDNVFFMAMHDATSQFQLFYPGSLLDARSVKFTLQPITYPDRVNGYTPLLPDILLVSANADGVDSIPLCVKIKPPSHIGGYTYNKIRGDRGELLYGIRHDLSNFFFHRLRSGGAVTHDGLAYFIASHDEGGERRYGIWSFDPKECDHTTKVITATKLNTPTYDSYRNPNILLSHDDQLYYNQWWLGGSGSNLDSLWMYKDGVASEAHRTILSNYNITSMASAGGRIYMLRVNAGVHSSLGTVETFVTSTGISLPKYLIPSGSDMYVIGGRRSTEGRGPNYLYKAVDGSSDFTLVATSAVQMNDALQHHDALYYIEAGYGGGTTLIKVLPDGSGVETIEFEGITRISRLFTSGDQLFFVGTDAEHGNELYKLN